MATAIRNLLPELMGSREGVESSLQAFPRLDIDQIGRELRLESRAEQAAGLDQPPSDARQPDLAELDVRNEIERRAAKAGEEYRSQLSLYEGRIRRALITVDQGAKIEAYGQNALADFKAQIASDLDHLHSERHAVEGLTAEYTQFREENHLARLPRIVSKREKIGRSLFLVILFLVEAVLNGTFFAEGSALGLVGGFMQAAVLSFLNIGGAFLCAKYALPLLFHHRTARRLAGGLLVAGFVVYALTLNLGIAHLRDLYISGEGSMPMAELVARLRTAPLVLSDAQSMLLGLLGVALSLVTLIDVAGFDDLYPGYGGVGRRQLEAVRFYAGEKTRCVIGLQGLRDGAISEMIQVIEAMRTSEFDLRLAIEGRDRLHKNYLAFMEHLVFSHQRLVRQYREANRNKRKSQAPTYFAEPIGALDLGERPTLGMLHELDEDTRKQTVARMEHYVTAVNRAYEEALAAYESVTRLAERGAEGAPA
jgi:hypothetical protein